jgi:hypothetical protein
MPRKGNEDPVRDVACIAPSRSAHSLIRVLDLGRVTEGQSRTPAEWAVKVSSNIVGIKGLRILICTRISQSTVPSVSEIETSAPILGNPVAY